jgi:Flp pilus assembly protein TadD
MIDGPTRKPGVAGQLPRLVVALSAVLALSACAQNGGGDLLSMSPLGQETADKAPPTNPAQALAYYGSQYTREPKNKAVALKYAEALSEMGHKARSMAILRQSYEHHSADPEYLSAYGRAALANGQPKLAAKLLAGADDPARPDWRIASARGTALAQQGSYAEATEHFERALKLAPSNPTALNNLAMAQAATGNLRGAESLRRKASQMPVTDPKVNRNLALVLRLQGRDDEATKVGRSSNAAPLRAALPPASARPAATNQVASAKPL